MTSGGEQQITASAKWTQLLILAAVLGCLLAAWNAVASFRDVQQFGGTDLRARVTGARMLLRGMDPYRTPINVHAEEVLQDPDRVTVGVTRSTYAPTVLLAYATFSTLPWAVQRNIWACIEWLSLLGSACLIYVAVLRNTSRLTKLAALAVFAGLFAGSYFWQLHVERGQYYAQILLMLTSSVALCIWGSQKAEGKADRWWYGIPLGLAASWRAPMLVIALPLWFFGLRRVAIGTVATCLACIAATLPLAGLHDWSSFTYLVAYNERLVLHPELEEADRHSVPYMNPRVEGATFGPNVLPSKDMNTAPVGMLQQTADRAHVPIPFRDQWPTFCRVLIAFLCLGAILVIPRLNKEALTITERMALCTVFLLVVDQIFTPIRAGYADILFVLPFGLLAPSVARNRRLLAPTIVALTGIAISNAMNFLLGGHGVSATLVRDVCILSAVIWVLLLICRPVLRRTEQGTQLRFVSDVKA